MKKRIIALVSAIAMMLPMAFATVNAAEPQDTGVSVVYNEKESTPTSAVLDVYIKGYSNVTYLELTLDGSAFTEATKNNVTYTNQSITAATPSVSTRGGTKFKFVAMDASAALKIDETKPVVSWTIPVTANTEIAADFSTADISINNGAYQSLIATAQNAAVPVREIAAGDSTVISDNADAPKATYWTAEATFTSELVPFWYATVNGDAKKVEAAVPTIDATATLGLIVEGDDTIADVKIVLE